MAQASWGQGPSWGPSGDNNGGQGGNYWNPPGCGPGGYFGLWSISRPLLIAATIIGFIIWWPIGLALLFLSLWNRRFGRWAFSHQGGFGNGAASNRSYSWAGPWSSWKSRNGYGRGFQPSSGNQAFDEYREQTIRRLEEEQKDFAGFLDRLRFAKDKAEFDQFMSDRRQPPKSSEPQPQPEG
jgi:hypothetical protein